MAINIKFDLIGNPEPPTIILATRNGNKLGQLEVDEKSIELTERLNDASEFSFVLNKYVDNRITNLWDKVVDFKLVYCKEWDTWFEIKVEIDEESKTAKTVFCKQLGQAELSQIMLYNIEINTEKDIEREDYKVSVLWNGNNDPEKDSMLDRLLEKAPHYSIAHVDSSIAKIQRTFTFDGTSIYDALQKIAEEIGCLFVFNSGSDINGKPQRTISVYDLQYGCTDCGYRNESMSCFVEDSNIYLIDEIENMLIDEFENHLLYRMAVECPKCHGENINKGYGEDTLIFVTSDELASGGIQLTTDTDSVKNCFKLEAGDDLMTATVRNCNPNGTDYIWRFSDFTKEDMSSELVKKLDSYDELYKYYYRDNVSDIDIDLLNKYNSLVNRYSVYNENLQRIAGSIKGYSSLMNAYYNTIDMVLYLESGLMPSVKMIETNASEQAALLTASSMSPVAVANITNASLATVNNAVLAMAKTIVKSIYKVKVNTSELADNGDKKYWNGNFILTNYSDDEDTAISEVISIEINDNVEAFVKQKLEKALNKEDTDDLSISGLFKKEYNDFCNELKKYALNPLISFRDACQSCIDILIEQGVSDTNDDSKKDLYENLYAPYYNKLMAIESEIKVREDEISIVSGVYDLDGNLIVNGLQNYIENCIEQVQNVLDFESYLGNKLWLEFCCYRREDKYSNSNYISDGLNNADLFKRALEFYEVAESEIYKSSELQHSISTTLNNLMAVPKFKQLIKSFNVGNWIRVRIDDNIYKLRLIEYVINFGDFDNISVEFSDVTKIKNGITDVKQVLSQASSMASSYDAVKRQASQGESSHSILNSWSENGLNTTNTKIVNAENQNQIWDKNGILCRQYDQITDTYSNEQLKIINSTIAITDNNWETTKTAIGKYYYIDPHTNEQKSSYGVNGETIVGKLLIGERLDISNDNGDLEFGQNGFVVKNGVNTVAINPSNESIFNISNEDGNIFSLDEKGELVITGNITASSLTLIDGTKIESENITGISDVAISGSYDDLKDKPNLANVATSGSYNDLVNKPSLSSVATSGSYGDLKDNPTKLSDFTNDGVFITKEVDDLTNYYKKSEVDNLLDSKADTSSLAVVATTGSYNDLIDIDKLKEWVLEQIQSAMGQ